jgi:hypothetical protein
MSVISDARSHFIYKTLVAADQCVHASFRMVDVNVWWMNGDRICESPLGDFCRSDHLVMWMNKVRLLVAVMTIRFPLCI